VDPTIEVNEIEDGTEFWDGATNLGRGEPVSAEWALLVGASTPLTVAEPETGDEYARTTPN
jgi:hypothetical protein